MVEIMAYRQVVTLTNADSESTRPVATHFHEIWMNSFYTKN